MTGGAATLESPWLWVALLELLILCITLWAVVKAIGVRRNLEIGGFAQRGSVQVSDGERIAPDVVGEARFVGDAEFAGISISRFLNAMCYLITGIALIVAGLSGESGGTLVGALALGVGLIVYGAKVLLTRSSYWVSSAIYLVPFFAVVFAIAMLNT